MKTFLKGVLIIKRRPDIRNIERSPIPPVNREPRVRPVPMPRMENPYIKRRPVFIVKGRKKLKKIKKDLWGILWE
ncbi:MAG: hypothetical protein GF375_00485 [Candidatus Omnitrophica bacterium]|nr:hypothetical protein [Candidatus Omnitrophota bacterium]